ncbi:MULTISPECIES: CagC family type IV secretion system protein [Peribacillus]|uniref:CagC family type IV secretion system protein n=1 Tax=Peribacillus frigoritolerans TaxID=450367 RepID=A0AAJ1V9X2_9BACI|nr:MULTISPECIES: CagC family type IV secretion system protein [Peribacillus]MDM5281835.1 CagC family type IV secretion system protein [Peribacillus frigoritolerans]
MTSLKKLQLLLMFAAILLLLYIAPEQASAAANVSAKIKEGLKQVQTLLTGLVVTVGICVSIWIIIKKLPGVDDPHTKNEMFRGVGMALAGVGLAAAIVWLVPWMYALFA